MTISSRLRGISAFFLGCALFYAPLAYGCTRPDMLPALYLLLGISIAAGGAGFVLRGEWPKVPRIIWICFAALMAQGWWMAFHPALPSMVSSTTTWPEQSLEMVRRLSFDSMVMTTLLLGAFVVLCDTCCDAAWRRFLLMSVALSGTLIAVIGVVLKIVGEPLMRYVWDTIDIYWTEFAFFHYHGNAGAFLNLTWPLILVFTRRAWSREAFIGKRVVWTLAALFCGLGLLLNASKAALAIGLLIFPWPFSSGLKRLQHKTLFLLGLGTMLVIALALFATSQLAHEGAAQRITETAEVSASATGRWYTYGEYLQALPVTGWFGLGPGLFQVAFPYQESDFRNVGVGIREYAHQDFLQTTLEWGWFGTIWWALLVGGGLYRGLKTYAQRERFTSRTDRHLVLGCVLGLLGTLTHSLFDFPLQIASIRLFFLLLLALCWASPELLTPLPPVEKPKLRRYKLPVPSEYYKKLAKSSSGSPPS